MKRKSLTLMLVVLIALAASWMLFVKEPQKKGSYLPDTSPFPTGLGGWRIDWMRKDFDVTFFDGNDEYFSSIVYAPDVPDIYLKDLKNRIIREEKIVNGHSRIVEMKDYPTASRHSGPIVGETETELVAEAEYILQIIRFKKGSGIPFEDWFPSAMIDGQFKILAYKPKSEPGEVVNASQPAGLSENHLHD